MFKKKESELAGRKRVEILGHPLKAEACGFHFSSSYSFLEDELAEDSVVKKFFSAAADGKTCLNFVQIVQSLYFLIYRSYLPDIKGKMALWLFKIDCQIKNRLQPVILD